MKKLGTQFLPFSPDSATCLAGPLPFYTPTPHLRVRNVVMKCDIIITSSVQFLIIFMADYSYDKQCARLIWCREWFIMTSISRPNTVVWYINGQRKVLSTRL